ncbi:MAG: methylated-DNA--[protein]-cysteine S-methyltransferase [Neisseria sp.]|nr:methylated-DNA--[protein]-cysteine S-methyltransferase [Neisseria sp.]
MKYAVYYTSFGQLYLLFADDVLRGIDFALPADITEQQRLPERWRKQLNAYFSGSLHDFDYPPSEHGTAFQRAVWQLIADIPYGKTATYSDLAKKLNSHPRAVGQACGKNPLPIVIPCHRVLAKNGGLGGFSMGDGSNNLSIKQFLLRLEGVLP